MSAQHEYLPTEPVVETSSALVSFDIEEAQNIHDYKHSSPAQTSRTISLNASAIANGILSKEQKFGQRGERCVGASEYFFNPDNEPSVELTKSQKEAFSNKVSLHQSVAKLLCKACPLKVSCLDDALSLDLRIDGQPILVQGIWGDTTERERTKIQRRRAVQKLYSRSVAY